MPNIVVIGAVAAGTSAASQAKRRQPESHVILLERGKDVSYGACGIPYNLQSPAKPIDDLVAISAERFRNERHIDLRVCHEVLAIEPADKRLRVRDHAAGRDLSLPYDALVIATGARAVTPPVLGVDLPGVFRLRELKDGAAIKQALAGSQVRSAVVVGAGYIGLEMVETLRARGVSVRLLEKAPAVAPGFDPAIVARVREELERHRVEVQTAVELRAIERGREAGLLSVRTSQSDFDAQLVLIAVGVRPNVELARAAGIAIGETGAIAVDAEQRTNLPHIWAAGDCAEATHRVTGKPVWIPLGTTANKQGKVAGANASGASERFEGIVGTAVFKVFDLQVARTGLGPAELERLGIDAVRSVSEQGSRASSVEGGAPIQTVVWAAPGTGRLLGVQMAGRDGVGKRIDVFATALHAQMTVSDIEALDLAYAPPFAPVYDPILIAGSVAQKALKRRAAE